MNESLPSAGVHVADHVSSGDAAAQLRAEGRSVYVLRPDPTDKRSFIESAAEVLPFDPPLDGSWPPNWDGFYDSVTGGLAGLRAGDVAIIWPAAALRDADPTAFDSAMKVFADAAHLLGEPGSSRWPAKRVLVVVTSA